MKKIETNLLDCYILEPQRFGDERGYFESVTRDDLKSLGFNDIFQVSNSKSNKGILRGLHFQKDPYCQAKVVRCHRGAVLDVVVDIIRSALVVVVKASIPMLAVSLIVGLIISVLH